MGQMTRAVIAVFFLLVVAAQAQVERVDRDRMKAILDNVSLNIEKHYYDPSLKGLDWKALTDEARKKIVDATSYGQMITAVYVLVDQLHDSQTQFYPPERVERLLYGFDAKPFGDVIRIYALKRRSAAEAAGLQVGDRILAVNGFAAERSTWDQMMLAFRVLNQVTEMKIVYSRGGDAPQTANVVAKVKKSSKLVDLTSDFNLWLLVRELDTSRLDYTATFDGDIGYADISDFDVEDVPAIHKFDKSKAVILDLRENLGGRQDTLLEVAGHFEPQNTVMGEVVERKKTEPLQIKSHSPNLSGPVVVLVDSNSGSSAEMLARHLQRSRHAVVVGDRTSGRVNASLFYPGRIGYGTIVPFGVQVSVGKVVFPNGEELEQRGVTPDVPCNPREEDLREKRDPCLRIAVAAAQKLLGGSEQLSESEQKQVDDVALSIAIKKEQILNSAPD